MTSQPISPSILICEEWTPDRAGRPLPLVGTISAQHLGALASRLSFILLIAAIGMLVIHPGDLAESLADLPVYQALITCSLLASFPRVAAHLKREALRANAITSLVIVLLVAAIASHLARRNLYDARMTTALVGKLVLLYLLTSALLDSPARLRITLGWLLVFVSAMTLLALLQYHDVIHLPGIAHVVRQGVDAATEETTLMDRLCGVGKFNDPNDLSMILVVCMITGGYFLTDSRMSRSRRQILLPVLGMLLYALYLTHSRGGMLSAAAALLVFLWTRMGGRNFVAVACLLLPMVLVIPWARPGNVDLNDPEDTFQTRLELWSDSLSQFRAAPVFGIGQGRIIDEIGQVTHNSYLHAYTEMGLLGGTAFLGISCLLLEGLWQASPEDRELARMRPYILAMIAGYSAGLMSLSRCYTAPTFLVFAVATAYLAMASRDGPAVLPELDGRCIRRIFVLGTLFLGAIYLFLRVMLYRGA